MCCKFIALQIKCIFLYFLFCKIQLNLLVQKKMVVFCNYLSIMLLPIWGGWEGLLGRLCFTTCCEFISLQIKCIFYIILFCKNILLFFNRRVPKGFPKFAEFLCVLCVNSLRSLRLKRIRWDTTNHIKQIYHNSI